MSDRQTNDVDPPVVFTSLGQLKGSVGKHLGHSAWLRIEQSRVDQFAEATGDFQWIHVDAERAEHGEAVQLTVQTEVEIKGREKPALVVESLGRYYL